MSKIIMYANQLLVKVTGHKYTGLTVKTPFINLSFAPAQKFDKPIHAASTRKRRFFVLLIGKPLFCYKLPVRAIWIRHL